MIHLDVANKFVLLSPLPVQKVHFRLIANDYGVGGGGGGGEVRRVCKRRGLYWRGLNSPNRKRISKKLQ